MWESPIKVTLGEFVQQAKKQRADAILDSVMSMTQKIGIDVDKEELIKALKYDRHQYDKGYSDGLAGAVKHAHWELHTCSNCSLYCEAEFYEYCPYCGAKMDEVVDETKD